MMASVISWAIMAPLAVWKLYLRLARMQEKLVHRKYMTMQWEDGDLDLIVLKVQDLRKTVGLGEQVVPGPQIRPSKRKGNKLLRPHRLW